jgi:hypothetical protein
MSRSKGMDKILLYPVLTENAIFFYISLIISPKTKENPFYTGAF